MSNVLGYDIVTINEPSGKGVYPHWKFPKEELTEENTSAVIQTMQFSVEIHLSRKQDHHKGRYITPKYRATCRKA